MLLKGRRKLYRLTRPFLPPSLLFLFSPPLLLLLPFAAAALPMGKLEKNDEKTMMMLELRILLFLSTFFAFSAGYIKGERPFLLVIYKKEEGFSATSEKTRRAFVRLFLQREREEEREAP